MKFEKLTEEQKKFYKGAIYKNNEDIASRGLLGFSVNKLSPSKENKKKFQEQFSGHPLCGCYGCLELAKIFINSNHSVKEEVIFESVKDFENFKKNLK